MKRPILFFVFFISIISVIWYGSSDTLFASTGSRYDHVQIEGDLFYEYTSWTHTQNPDRTGPRNVLSTLADIPGDSSNTPQKFSLVDINGDGLPDFLYHERRKKTTNYPVDYLAIFLNNGKNDFDLAYKCVVEYDTNLDPAYGDCAQGAPQRDPNDPENQNMKSMVTRMMSYYDPDNYEGPPSYRSWMDVNGDGLQDLVSTGFQINNGDMTFSNF